MCTVDSLFRDVGSRNQCRPNRSTLICIPGISAQSRAEKN